jgi:DNA-binding XRE family transcriptional regulator
VSESEMLRVIGANVRAARLKAGLTQECLAELVGLHWQTVSNIERGRYPCGVVVFFHLAQDLEVRSDDLLKGLPLVDQKRAAKIRKAMARKRQASEE